MGSDVWDELEDVRAMEVELEARLGGLEGAPSPIAKAIARGRALERAAEALRRINRLQGTSHMCDCGVLSDEALAELERPGEGGADG